MKPTRRHHYCPASYLASFASPQHRDGRLFVLDLARGKSRPSTPDKEGHERDFYRIEPADPSTDPNAIETEIGKIEASAAPAIRRVIESGSPPSNSDDFTELMNFLGLLGVRVPAKRRRWAGFQEKIYKMIMQMTAANEQLLKSAVARARAADPSLGEADYEKFKSFVDGDEYTVETHQNDLILTMLQQAGTLTELLARRRWHVATASGDETFVTSDDPVHLRWIRPIGGFRPPGYGLGNTEVKVALSPRTLLIGVFEEGIQGPFVLDDKGVQNFNAEVLGHASRFVYASNDNVRWLDDAGASRPWVEIVPLLARVRQK